MKLSCLPYIQKTKRGRHSQKIDARGMLTFSPKITKITTLGIALEVLVSQSPSSGQSVSPQVEWKSLSTKTRIYGLTVPEHFHQNDSTPPAVKEVTDQNIESNTNTGTSIHTQIKKVLVQC